MTLSGSRLSALAAAAREVAVRAGAHLRDRYGRVADIRTEFKGRRDLVTEADREAERIVVEGLLAAFPGDSVLAEEGVLTERGRASGNSENLWIVDPLDGTTNFVHGLPFFCVAVALCHRGRPVLGVVHAPVLDETFVAVSGSGATRNGARLEVSSTASLADALLATGFSYNRNEPGADDNARRVAAVLPLCRDLRRFGSAQLDLCMTAAGSIDGYWELELAPYDVAAGAVVVMEAGGRVTDLEGGDDWLYGGRILATNGHLHSELLAILGN